MAIALWLTRVLLSGCNDVALGFEITHPRVNGFPVVYWLINTVRRMRMPKVIGYGLGFRVLFELPLDQVQGMAYGVREDIQNGKRGLIANWCNGPVVWWGVE